MTSGADQQNSTEKNRSKKLRKSTKRPASSMDGAQAKQIRGDFGNNSDEAMEEEASSSTQFSENNLVENFKYQNKSAASGGEKKDKKKIVISNFSRKNRNTSNVEDIDNPNGPVGQHWVVLRENVNAILEDRKTETLLEGLFARVKAICDKNLGVALHERLVAIFIEYAKKLKESLKAEDQIPLLEDNCEQYLVKFGKIWEAYPVKANLIRNIFTHLDRTPPPNPEVEILPLWECSMQIYKTTFFPEVSKEFKSIKLFNALYMVMQRTMQKYTVDSPLRNLIVMISTVHVADDFTNFLLDRIREHYNRERVENVPVSSCNEYMAYAEDQITRYSTMVKVNFDEPAVLREVQLTLLHCLVQQAIPEILTHDFGKLMDDCPVRDVRRMFDLCRQCPGGEEEVRTQFSKYLKQCGQQLVGSCPDKDLVDELLRFKKKVDVIMTGGFVSATDPTKMRQCLADAFEVFINVQPDRAAELISKHFHDLLHSGNKTVTDDVTLDQKVDDAVVLFRYLRGKDVFEAYYKRGLAKRLFLERSASVDAEKMVLCKLKTECGAGFTYKLEGMFKDMDASENLGKLFLAHQEHSNKDKINFTARVITPEYWPTYDPYEINIPKEMRDTLTDYNDFYRSQHGNRNVKWHHGLGTAVVLAQLRQKDKKEFVGTVFQAVILLLFNKCDTWTVKEIVECTKIEEMEVIRNVLALLGAKDKPRLLLRVGVEDNQKEATVTTVRNEKFSVNTGFIDKRYRIRLTQVNIKTLVEEKKDVEQEVNQDRQYQIDAAIVRIMKARKEMTHNNLMNEVLTQLKFPVKSSDIKLRIESLIEREYISRDENDHSTFKYVA